MVRRVASFVVVGILVAACSGSAGGGSYGAGAGSSDGTPVPAATTTDGGDSGGGSAGKPSGAKVRIVNAYVPLNGDPGPIDVYAAPWVAAGAKPLLSVPYGTVSDWFDPTVADDQGDMFLSAYRAGESGNGREIVSQTETLKGGEAITFFVATGNGLQEGGGRFGEIQAFYGRASTGDSLQNTPAPGKARLVVSSVGLDNVIKKDDAAQWLLGLGSGCTKAVGDDTNTQTEVSPGTATTYDVDPGAYTARIHAYPADSQTLPDCGNASVIGDVPVTLAADASTVIFVFAPKDGDLRTLVVPLQP